MKVFVISYTNHSGRLESTRIEAETMVSGIVTFQQTHKGITPKAVEEKGTIVIEKVFRSN